MASLELGGMRSIKLWLKTIRNSLKDTSAALSIPALEIKQLPESVSFNLPMKKVPVNCLQIVSS